MIRKGLIFGAGAAVTCTFFINFCAWIFQCGCLSLWAGAAATCNIHHAGVKHCPWCAHNPVWAFGAMLAAQFAVSVWPASWHWAARLGLALAAFPAAGVVMAGIYGWLSGYWSQ